MYGYLTLGERRLPVLNQALNAPAPTAFFSDAMKLTPMPSNSSSSFSSSYSSSFFLPPSAASSSFSLPPSTLRPPPSNRPLPSFHLHGTDLLLPLPGIDTLRTRLLLDDQPSAGLEPLPQPETSFIPMPVLQPAPLSQDSEPDKILKPSASR
jgi:hypothetical protein